MRGVVVWLCGMAMCLLLPACSSNKPPIPSQNFVTWSKQAPQQKKQLCVLPFEDTSHIDGLAKKVREGVAGRLSIKRFADTELHEIDSALAAIGPSDWRRLSPQALGQKLDCDALVYGRVSKLDRFYIGIYSQLALEGTLQIVESDSARTLVHETYTTRFHDAGLPLSPVDFATSAVRNLRAFSDSQFIRAIDDLSRNLAGQVPDLPEVDEIQVVAPKKDYPDLTKPPQRAARPQLTSRQRTPVASRASAPPYRIQVAAFSSHDDAQQAAQLLRSAGYTSAIARVTGSEQDWHRVIIAPFSSAQTAYEVGVQIKEKLPFNPIVTQGPLPAP